jgi:hypothetical protein
MKENLKKIRNGVHVAVLDSNTINDMEATIKILTNSRAEKLYLVVPFGMPKTYAASLQKRLSKEHIKMELKYYHNEKLGEFVNIVSKITERESKNYTDKIFINASNSILCLAGILISNIPIFKNIKIVSYIPIRGFDIEIIDFPFDIVVPKEELIIFLKFIGRKGYKGISTKELIDLISEETLKKNDYTPDEKKDIYKLVNWRLESADKSKNKPSLESNYKWIDRNVMAKLLEHGLINKPVKKGKYKVITINEKGKQILEWSKYLR